MMWKRMLASDAVDKDAQKIIVYLSDGRANLSNNRAVPAAIEAAKSNHCCNERKYLSDLCFFAILVIRFISAFYGGNFLNSYGVSP